MSKFRLYLTDDIIREISNFIILFICLVCLFVLIHIMLVKKKVRLYNKEFLGIIMVSEGISLLLDFASRFELKTPLLIPLIRVSCVLSAAFSVVALIGIYGYTIVYMKEKGAPCIGKWTKKGIIIYFIASTCIFTLALVDGRIYKINTDGILGLEYVENFEYVYLLLVPLILLELIKLYKYKSYLTDSEKRTILLCYLIPCIASLIDMCYKTVTFHIVMLMLCVSFYIHINEKREKLLAHKQTELEQSKMEALLLQINPHFIYNTLGSVDSLCRTNPDDAQKLLRQFAGYLRNNHTDINRRMIIPFKEELNHLKQYLSIENVRFPDVEMIYNIQAMNFDIPCITLQPLVENALHHGICRRLGGKGSIKISSYEEESAWIVSVEDDGVGFDETPQGQTGKKHIGIENVRKRLDMLCGGTLEIKSEKNKGTICKIVIPKKQK